MFGISPRIKDLITMFQQTRPIEILTMMTIANDHQQHRTMIKVMTNDLAMTVDDHHHTIAPTPKCAVRAAQGAATNTITDKGRPFLMGRTDANININIAHGQCRSNNQMHLSHRKTEG
jgi:hypothetical protein